MSKKIFVSVMLIFLFASLFPAGVVFAQDDDREPSIFDGAFMGFDPDEYVNEDGKRMSWMERSVANTLWWFMRAMITWLRLDPIESLIYQRPMQVYSAFGTYTTSSPLFYRGHNIPEIGGIFYENEWNGLIKPAFRLFQNLAFALIAISVVVGGFKIAASAGNPLGRAEAKEMMLNWVITAVALGIMLYVVLFIFDINTTLVMAIEGLIDPSLVSRFGEGESQFVTMRLSETLTTGSWFFTFFAQGYLIILTAYFNILYLLRKFIIMILIVVGPLVLWAWGKGHQTSLYLWASELLSNILMQAVHALVFAFYFNIAATSGVGFMGSPFGKMLLLLMIVPVGVLLRKLITGWFNLLGLDEEATASGVLGGIFAGGAALIGIGSGVVKAFKGGGGGGGSGSYSDYDSPDDGDNGGGSKSYDTVKTAVKAGAIGSFFGGPAGSVAGVLAAVGGGLASAVAAPVGHSLGGGASTLGTSARRIGEGVGSSLGYTSYGIGMAGAAGVRSLWNDTPQQPVSEIGADQEQMGQNYEQEETSSYSNASPGFASNTSPLNSPMYMQEDLLNFWEKPGSEND